MVMDGVVVDHSEPSQYPGYSPKKVLVISSLVVKT
jgi:hypothetical protein